MQDCNATTKVEDYRAMPRDTHGYPRHKLLTSSCHLHTRCDHVPLSQAHVVLIRCSVSYRSPCQCTYVDVHDQVDGLGLALEVDQARQGYGEIGCTRLRGVGVGLCGDRRAHAERSEVKDAGGRSCTISGVVGRSLGVLDAGAAVMRSCGVWKVLTEGPGRRQGTGPRARECARHVPPPLLLAWGRGGDRPFGCTVTGCQEATTLSWHGSGIGFRWCHGSWDLVWVSWVT